MKSQSNTFNIQEFLKDSVFYPCCGIDGTPIKFLGGRFRKFVYTDYSLKREELEAALDSTGLHGYEPVETVEFEPDVNGNWNPAGSGE